MTRYSVQPRYRIFVKGCRFLSFAKYIGNNVGKNISKNASSKCSQKLLNHAKQSATDSFKNVSRAAIQKPAEGTGDLIGIILNGKIKKVSKHSLQNNLETVTNENNKEKPKERYTSPEKRQEIFEDLRCLII